MINDPPKNRGTYSCILHVQNIVTLLTAGHFKTGTRNAPHSKVDSILGKNINIVNDIKNPRYETHLDYADLQMIENFRKSSKRYFQTTLPVLPIMKVTMLNSSPETGTARLYLSKGVIPILQLEKFIDLAASAEISWSDNGIRFQNQISDRIFFFG